MSDQDLGFVLLGVAIGLVLGVVFVTMRDRFQSKGVSREQLQAEFDDYKEQVETHFSATSKKFHQVTEQYKELYEHLSVGATTLCDTQDSRPMFAKSSVDTLLEKTEEEPQSPKPDLQETPTLKPKSEEMEEIEDAEISEVQNLDEIKKQANSQDQLDAMHDQSDAEEVAYIKRNKETGLPDPTPDSMPDLKH